jgi:hypothetical protein
MHTTASELWFLNLDLDFRYGSVVGELKILDEAADVGSIWHRTQTSKLKVIIYSSSSLKIDVSTVMAEQCKSESNSRR